jgi:hypothetical protein
MDIFLFTNYRKEPITVSIELWAMTYVLGPKEAVRVEYRSLGHQLEVTADEDGSMVVGIHTDQIRIFVRERLEYEFEPTDKVRE